MIRNKKEHDELLAEEIKMDLEYEKRMENPIKEDDEDED
jgi:hypothetical protein